jgi:hypothetical protein
MRDPDGMFKIKVTAPSEGFVGDGGIKMNMEISILNMDVMDCFKAVKVAVKEKRSFR